MDAFEKTFGGFVVRNNPERIEELAKRSEKLHDRVEKLYELFLETENSDTPELHSEIADDLSVVRALGRKTANEVELAEYISGPNNWKLQPGNGCMLIKAPGRSCLALWNEERGCYRSACGAFTVHKTK